jgi:hypothetical protein
MGNSLYKNTLNEHIQKQYVHQCDQGSHGATLVHVVCGLRCSALTHAYIGRLAWNMIHLQLFELTCYVIMSGVDDDGSDDDATGILVEEGDQDEPEDPGMTEAEFDNLCEKWRVIPTKKASDVRVTFSPVETELLDSTISEWEEVHTNLQREAFERGLNVEAMRRGEIEPVLQYFLSDMIDHMLGHVNSIALREGNNNISRKDILAFIKLELMTCIYSESPTSLYKHDPGYVYFLISRTK